MTGRKAPGGSFLRGSGTGGGGSAFRVRVFCRKADKTPSPGPSLSNPLMLGPSL
jgi:hypothetical protein